MSERRIYVVGHRNPDTDSVAAAISYAEFKRQMGESTIEAAAAGGLNPQTRYILQRLAIPEPRYLSDVFPRVQDIVRSRPVTARGDTPLRDALALFHRHSIRILPVVDEEERPVGLISLLKLSECYLAAGADGSREIATTVSALVQSLSAEILTGAASDELKTRHLFVGAMSEASFVERIDGYHSETLLIVTGDRPEIQELAVARGVGILIVTGGRAVAPQLCAAAREAGVTLLVTPHDTATAAWLARLSTPLQVFADTSFAQVELDDSVDALRLKLLHSGEPAVLVVDGDGRLSGVATKSSLLSPPPYALILVDHNELNQAIPGADGVEILEVIDHHKLGNPPTNQPIAFTVAPVGSTCSLVAARFRDSDTRPTPQIAALLMAGILSDTVILKSPTTTPFDRQLISWLEPLAGVDHQNFGREIFAACSGFAAHDSLLDAVRIDFKHFSAGDFRFGVGQVEVVDFSEFAGIVEELRQTLLQVRREDRLQLAALMVTDIHSETTLLLTTPLEGLELVIGSPQQAPQLFPLPGVMSRKKQLVPLLLKALGQLGVTRT